MTTSLSHRFVCKTLIYNIALSHVMSIKYLLFSIIRIFIQIHLGIIHNFFRYLFLISTSGAIYLNMITFILSALIISTIHTYESKEKSERFDLKQYRLTLKKGMKYAFSQKTILLFCLIALFLNGIIVPYFF